MKNKYAKRVQRYKEAIRCKHAELLPTCESLMSRRTLEYMFNSALTRVDHVYDWLENHTILKTKHTSDGKYIPKAKRVELKSERLGVVKFKRFEDDI